MPRSFVAQQGERTLAQCRQGTGQTERQGERHGAQRNGDRDGRHERPLKSHQPADHQEGAERAHAQGGDSGGKAEGREVRGVADHHFIRSIYFRDPNGYVIELTAKVAGRESDMDPQKNRAREILDRWQDTKPRPARAA